MELDVTFTRNDWSKFNKYIQRKKLKERKGLTGSFWANVALWLFIVMVVFFVYRAIESLHWPTVAIISLLFICLIVYWVILIVSFQKSFMPSNKGIFVGTHHFEFSEKGIKSSGLGYSSFHDWDTVKGIERGNGLVIIFLDTAYGFIFPESGLENVDSFINELERLRA